MRLGKVALDMERDDLAAEAFDHALKGIEEVYADNPQAERARSIWHAESVKDFKGEPHERAMAYYYRGLLYLRAGDFENARASFRGAMLQDSYAENERFRQDFAVAAWLDGWASHCMGQQTQAAEAFREASVHRPRLMPANANDNLLVIAEAGYGPVKEAYGQYREKLAYRERDTLKVDLAAKAADQVKPLRVAEDLYFQATTRGGRAMDTILAAKADTKLVTGAVGAGATVVGAEVMNAGAWSNDRNATAVGAIVMVVGLMAQAAAQNMNAEADTRSWGGLANTILLTSFSMAGNDYSVDVSFADGETAIRDSKGVQLSKPAKCHLAWAPAAAVKLAPSRPSMPSSPASPPSSIAKAIHPVQTGGNCRTANGSLVTLEPTYCRNINGQVLAYTPPK